ncbi:MAG TPA: NAD(P)-dependent oxidoreductase [Armatimonadota bacterium]|jgi:nucleoside-diphosphate-sugar epimerase
MQILIIGGTGHHGAFLTDLLDQAGHEVTVMSSGRIPPPERGPQSRVRYVVMPYHESMADGSFHRWVVEHRPQVIVDILQGEMPVVYEACLAGGVEQLVACGSLWMWGRPKVVPTPPAPQTVCPFEGYRNRLAQMQAVIEQARGGSVAVCGIMPPNICGPGKIPLDCAGGRSVAVHQAHRRGEEVVLPDPGTNLVGPCDAFDVAAGYVSLIEHRAESAGRIFNVGAAYALTSERFVASYGEIYGVQIPVRYVAPEVFAREIMPDEGANFHFLEHMCPDISALVELGFRPRYTPEQTLERAVRWMFDEGVL